MCAEKDKNYYTSTCRLDKENRGEKGFGGKSLILERIPTLSHTKAKKNGESQMFSQGYSQFSTMCTQCMEIEKISPFRIQSQIIL